MLELPIGRRLFLGARPWMVRLSEREGLTRPMLTRSAEEHEDEAFGGTCRTMNFLLWIILGGVAGWLASLVMKTNREQGTILDIVVGIIGAVIGGFLFETLGRTGVTGFNIYSLLVAFVGAVILLAIVKAVRRS